MEIWDLYLFPLACGRPSPPDEERWCRRARTSKSYWYGRNWETCRHTQQIASTYWSTPRLGHGLAGRGSSAHPVKPIPDARLVGKLTARVSTGDVTLATRRSEWNHCSNWLLGRSSTKRNWKGSCTLKGYGRTSGSPLNNTLHIYRCNIITFINSHW